MGIREPIRRLAGRPWLPLAAALLVGLVYLGHGLVYAHYQDVTMDEGTYLMKGLLYLQGDYRPFQDYGPNTNKMPLAFLLPGLPQVLFSPGLRTGRYFSLFLGAVMLAGLYLGGRRLGGRWWGTLAVLMMVVSPANLFIYSQALTQVQVACLLTWSLALALGPGRKGWELALSSALAVAVVFTRQNMAPLMALLWVYIAWQHGRRAAWLSGGVMAGLFAAGHIPYWPNIMKIWLPWMPDGFRDLFDFLNLSLAGGKAVYAPSFDGLTQLSVFWEGMRYNFLALFGAVFAWILWPPRRSWAEAWRFRAGVCLSVFVVMMAAAHYWVSVAKDYCLFCYSGYLTFFIPAAIFLVAATFPAWVRRPGALRQGLLALTVVVGSAGLGYGAWRDIGYAVMDLTVPRVAGGRLLPGTTELWRLFANKFALSPETLRLLLPALAGLGVGLALTALAAVWALTSRRRGRRANFGLAALALFLGLGALLSPTPALGGGRFRTNLCAQDVIASHEAAGAHLASIIPAGSLVYWLNDTTPLPLLYIPDVRIFPGQLNHWYTYREGGKRDNLLKNGFWSKEIGAEWLRETDYALIEDKYVVNFTKNADNARAFDELAPSEPVVGCRPDSAIHIFRRNP